MVIKCNDHIKSLKILELFTLISLFLLGILCKAPILNHDNITKVNEDDFIEHVIKTPRISKVEDFLTYNWWNKSWFYRIPIKIPKVKYNRTNPIIIFNVNFSNLIAELNPGDSLDNASLRLISYNKTGGIKVCNNSATDSLRFCIPIQYEKEIGSENQEELTIAAIWPWNIEANNDSYAFLYFDTQSHGSKSPLNFKVGTWADSNLQELGGMSGDDAFKLKNDFVEIYRNRDTATGYMDYINDGGNYIKDVLNNEKLVTGFKVGVCRYLNKSSGFSHHVDDSKNITSFEEIFTGPVYSQAKLRIQSSNPLKYNEDTYCLYRIYRNHSVVEFYLWTKRLNGFEQDPYYYPPDGTYRKIYFPTIFDRKYSDSKGDQQLIYDFDESMRYLILYNSTDYRSVGYWAKSNGALRTPNTIYPPYPNNAFDSYDYTTFTPLDFVFRYFWRIGDVNETKRDFEALKSQQELIQYTPQEKNISIIEPIFGKLFTTRDSLSINLLITVDNVINVSCCLIDPIGSITLIILNRSGNLWYNNTSYIFTSNDREGDWLINITVSYLNGSYYLYRNTSVSFKIMEHPNLLFSAGNVYEYQDLISFELGAYWYRLYNSAVGYLDDEIKTPTSNNLYTHYGEILEKLAFVYLMTNEYRFLNKCEIWMLTIVNYSSWETGWHSTDLQRSHYSIGICMAFDMLFDYITPENRSIILEKLIEQGYYQYDIVHNNLEWQVEAYDNNHNWITLTSLATLAYCLDGYLNTTPWKEEVRTRFQNVFDLLWDDGTSHEGVNYWLYGISYIFRYAAMRQRFNGENILELPFFKNATMFRAYYMLPNLKDSLMIGDTYETFDYEDFIFFGLAKQFNDTYAKWLSLYSDQNIEKVLFFDRYGTGSGTIFRDKTHAHSGLYSLGVNDSETTAYSYAASKNVYIDPSKNFTLSGWVISDNPEMYNVFATFHNSGGTQIYAQQTYGLATTTWTSFSMNLTNLPITTVYCKVLLRPYHPYDNISDTGIVYFDDITLSEWGSNRNLLINPGAESYKMNTHPLDIIFYPKDVEVKDLNDLPLYHYFQNIGIFVQRSSWTTEAAHFAFKCGPIRGGHDHPDTNSFTLTFGDTNLAIDPGYSYNKSTDNHNTMLFDNQGQIGEHDQWMNDVDPEHWGYIYGVLANEYFAMMTGNGTPAYDESIGLKKWDRSIFMMPDDFYIIQDSIRFSNSKNYTWLLHFPGNGTMNGDKTQINCGEGKMTVYSFSNGTSTHTRIIENATYVPNVYEGSLNTGFVEVGFGNQLRINPTTLSSGYELLNIIVPLKNFSDEPLSVVKLETNNYLGVNILKGQDSAFILKANNFGEFSYTEYDFEASSMGKYHKKTQNLTYYFLEHGTSLKKDGQIITSLNNPSEIFIQYNHHKNVTGNIVTESGVVAEINISHPDSNFKPQKIAIYVDDLLLPESSYQYNYETRIVSITFSKGTYKFTIIQADITPTFTIDIIQFLIVSISILAIGLILGILTAKRKKKSMTEIERAN